MSVPAGDLKLISVDHPELDPIVFQAKSGEDVNVKLGGFMSSDDDGNITVSGIRIDVLNRKPWEVTLTIANVEGHHMASQRLTEHSTEGTWIFQFADGSYWTGSGKPVGDLEKNDQSGSMSIKIQGSGRLQPM